MKKIIILVFLSITSIVAIAQDALTIYPTHWWVNMKNPKLQLLIHGDGAGVLGKVQLNYPGVKVENVHRFDNKNYLAVDLIISPAAKAGSFKINVKREGKPLVINYELKTRRPGNGTAFAQGVTSSDFVYLLMPERFSNGDTSNDKMPGMRDQTLNRDSVYHRHGGDLQGVINHLDYIQSLGVSTVWMTPVLENDRTSRTEHGYGISNHYKVDPRYGGDEQYKKLSNELHKRGMKLIQDAVYNHVDIHHFFQADPPAKDWIHQWPTFTRPNYKDQVLFDPYAAPSDKKTMVDGWFDYEMPDVNQNNPYVANFLIQNAIWSVEEFGVDGWRIDTYIYNDLDFMNRCNKALTDEYPKMTMFGETWVHGTASQAYFTANNYNTPFKSNLTGATDFQALLYGILPAIKDNFGWTDGVNKLYTTLSNDFLYKNAYNNCIFLDNHDLTRIATELGGDAAKVKTALAWLFTCRGIPQLYYGTEVFMKGDKGINDGMLRLDLPGGWQGDAKSVFTEKGLATEEKDMLDYVRLLGNFRKKSSAIKTGKMMQYLPVDGLYVYFRYDNNQTVMCIMNTAKETKKINISDYKERTAGFANATVITDSKTYKMTDVLSVEAGSMWVLELKK